MADKPVSMNQSVPPLGVQSDVVEASNATPEATEELGEPGLFDGLGGWLHSALRATPSWLFSSLIHMLVFILLALYTIPPELPRGVQELFGSSASEEEAFDPLEELMDEPLDDFDLSVDDAVIVNTDMISEIYDEAPANDLEAAAVHVDLSDFGAEHAPSSDLLTAVGAYTGNGVSGRGRGARASLVARGGGSESSERAVALALEWLVAHQMRDGGWSFNHQVAPYCQGRCRNPGSEGKSHPSQPLGARNAATAIALLPFLGAGQTHKSGKYKGVVGNGLRFLVGRIRGGGSLHEPGGTMYSHGLGAIALCEAYAMTQDRTLKRPAQVTLDFIAFAQDPRGGGWRYAPGEAGDTSVVGWQVMALKSGNMAYLQLNQRTIDKASMFLDSVQMNSGANYGYTAPGDGGATTAIGLLCRMHLGWKKNNPAMQRGVKWLGKRGPSKNNYYYNYYATQVMRHWEGEAWKTWNSVMRDQLVNSQGQAGHEKGSWYSNDDPHNPRGGRLYCTAMAAMILEVYYRHLPIYQKQSIDQAFPE